MDRQTLRDWAHRFNAEGPAGLTDRPRSGRDYRLNEAQMAELAEIVETSPDPAVDAAVRWRRIDLKRVIEERFGVVDSERAISALLAGPARLPSHQRPAPAPGTGRARDRGIQKNCPRTLAAPIGHLPKGKPLGVWFLDGEA